MLFDFNFYSCILLVFFIHILVYSILFFKRSWLTESYADRLMSIFMLLSALLIIPFMVGFAGWYDTQPYRDILFFVPFVHTLFLGPLLYFYTRSIFDFEFRIRKKMYLHFLPGILYLLYTIVDSLTNLLITHHYRGTLERQDPDFDQWYTLLSMASILSYLYLSYRYYGKYKKYTTITTSFADQASAKWLRNFLYAFALLCIMPIIKTILSNFEFFERMRYFGPWYYYLGFAIVTYYIAINAYTAGLLPLYKVHFDPELLLKYEHVPKVKLDDEKENSSQPESTTAIDPIQVEKLQTLAITLAALMEAEKLFERSDLTLSEVAKKLGTNPVLLSRTVNQTFGLNFNDYINRFRTEAVIQRIALPEFKNQTLLAIAFDAGFNSKATFNRAFKKFTGKNPKEFLN